MPEVVEVEIRQSCALTSSAKGMSHVLPPMPGGIMEYPRHVKSGPYKAPRLQTKPPRPPAVAGRACLLLTTVNHSFTVVSDDRDDPPQGA